MVAFTWRRRHSRAMEPPARSERLRPSSTRNAKRLDLEPRANRGMDNMGLGTMAAKFLTRHAYRPRCVWNSGESSRSSAPESPTTLWCPDLLATSSNRKWLFLPQVTHAILFVYYLAWPTEDAR